MLATHFLSSSFPDSSFHPLPVFFHQQRRSQEQHLVTSRDWRGCGHRAPENSRYARTRARAQRTGRLSARHGGGKMVDKSRRGRGVLPCSRAPSLPPPQLPLCLPPCCLPWADHSSHPPPLAPPPGHFATQFLKVPSRRRGPISKAIPAVTSDCRDTQLSRTHRLHAH